MSWAADIDRAMERGRSPFDAGDLLAWLRAGRAHLLVGERMHASVVLLDGRAEVGHVCGRWNESDARWCWSRAGEWAKARGFDSVVVRGRAGWARFLRRYMT